MASRIRAWIGLHVSRLKNGCRLVVAEPGIDGANERELIEHGSLFGQMLTNESPRQLRARHAVGAAILQRLSRLRVPSVYVAGAAGHPQQNHTVAALGAVRFSTRLLLQQAGKAQ